MASHRTTPLGSACGIRLGSAFVTADGRMLRSSSAMAPRDRARSPAQGQLRLSAARAARPATTAVVDPSEARAGARGGGARRGWRTHPHPQHPPSLRPHRRQSRAEGGHRLPDRRPGARPRPHPRHRRRRSTRATASALGDAAAEILFIPGHTRGHIAYWFAEAQAVFCGDTLFSLGCGRMFEGTPEQMWTSLVQAARAAGRRPGSIAATNTPRPTPASR